MSSRKPPLRPVVWHPPRRPRGPVRGAAPAGLSPVRRLPLGASGPEDVRWDAAADRLLTGVADGRILSVDPAGGPPRTLAATGGRPLGLCPLPDGRLLVCDAERGLLRLDPASGRTETLLGADGDPLWVCSNAVVAPDGAVYVSDASARFPLEHWMGDLLEHSGTGRLLRYELGAARPEVVLEGLQFANGVAVTGDGSSVVVAESGAYRLTRLWLTGPRAGRREVFADALPGFPDNLSTGPDGLVWVALAGPREPVLDLLHRSPPVLRRAVWALPSGLLPGPRPVVRLLALDAAGRVVRDLRRPERGYRMVTSVCVHAGRLYLGSLVESAVGMTELPGAV
ncbi:SMP-30/gluconolactonase/LRE family protein [Streptomyces mobaraensis NBRC 13819 = DSM 40847]|uniref:Strictosidine synthase n=1 Tax=Streptomyces mobaraensis (strain ATCC 29032 / DSM 40847 / JCM 4168 / NBRC 13819 / NCIMB 11159 / IPCR 16-22) TaxID=1223523 RepID=M2ZUS5_STRM1|nr:SMP-30/gluconolactonase/LRE family protein [Streptomyces mobaraensis]EME96478.1 strictosidine synthase [Streptomyces mobaraensis NBRC 13819 = DSM 40847]QTT72334.1 SMP-30/gluconolactonase/LRE family protein [Streptomyces mobaraensis NBRC 13819 = DSM 40847]